MTAAFSQTNQLLELHSAIPPPLLTTYPLALVLVQAQAHQFYFNTLGLAILASRSFYATNKELGASQPLRI